MNYKEQHWGGAEKENKVNISGTNWAALPWKPTVYTTASGSMFFLPLHWPRHVRLMLYRSSGAQYVRQTLELA